MKQFEVIQNTLPGDVALKIVSMLSVRDLCALGCCSRFWRELCGSDCIWESLTRERWPSLVCFDFSASSSSSAPPNAPNFKEWRKLYIEKHNEVAVRAAAAAKFVEESSPSKSLEVGDYLKAISILDDMKLGFKDVQMCLFRPNLKVLVNLVGLHYCLTWLRIPGDQLKEALQVSEIAERHVCVKWWKLGRWFFGFRMRDESHSRWASLADLATDDDEHLLAVLIRGAIHEVLRVQISSEEDHHTNPWSAQITQGHG
ncbi:uncharacterized protein LOC129293014 [Prosopis cineraria]|uniref:uncharacterized protein LOC129293014 n=1 Tax=Prosopis cineraria TaxID=364024 RepID=UPI002410153F|nr:uncharacterized protein LOC129293014 [Prosopis cineraria]